MREPAPEKHDALLRLDFEPVDLAFIVADGFVMNDVPIRARSREQAPDLLPPIRELMIHANVSGYDLGSKFTPIGGLATLLWRPVLEGKSPGTTRGQSMKVGSIITPPVLPVTPLARAAGRPLLGTR